MDKHDVIVVTDGDPVACQAVEIAAKDLGLRVISLSGGHPTKLAGQEIADQISKAKSYPVIVFLDDRGDQFQGRGETALIDLMNYPNVNVIGAIAVASEAKLTHGVHVDASVTMDGQLISNPVDKNGRVIQRKKGRLKGDTVDVLDRLDIPVIIGLGDPGKQHHHDDIKRGAPLTKLALTEIIKRSSNHE